MSKRKTTVLHRLEYIGWLAVTGALKLVPRSGMIVLADAIGWAFYRIFGVRRDVIDGQLQLALGEEFTAEDRRRIAVRSWQNVVLTFFEFLQPNPIGSVGWDRFREQEGYEDYCRPLLQTGKPALVITAHIGNWEALGALGEREGVQLAAVAKPMHNQLVNESILRGRAARGLEVLQIKASMKAIVDAARAGKWVAIVGDQDARRRGIFVEFFGRTASTAPGVAHFARLLDMPILPAYCVRLRDGGRHLKVIFCEPIYPDLSADPATDIHRMTQLHTRALEQVIRRHPTDYFWLHKRWKTKPKVRAQA